MVVHIIFNVKIRKIPRKIQSNKKNFLLDVPPHILLKSGAYDEFSYIDVFPLEICEKISHSYDLWDYILKSNGDNLSDL